MHGKCVRQRNVRQDNEIDRAGTLPLNLYEPYTVLKAINWFGGKRGVRGAECGKCGVWKMRGVENEECGKCQYEINKESNSFIFSLKECFIIL